MEIAGAALAGLRAGGIELTESRLVDVDLSGGRLAGLRLADVEVTRGNLANLAAPELSLRRIVVAGARLTGVQWTRGTIDDACFRDCRIDLATFAGTTLERVRFEGCLLAQTDFRDALLRVRPVRRLRPHGRGPHRRADRSLRAAPPARSTALAGVERLRGAAMPWADIVGHAALLAAALGIRVIDDAPPA